MRKFIKVLLLSISILIASVANTLPYSQENSKVLDYISQPIEIIDMTKNLGINPTKLNKLLNYPVNSPLRIEDIDRISSPFGMRKHPIFGVRMFHSGIDFASPNNSDIFSSGNGIVEESKYSIGYGNEVLIKHDEGYKTRYAHLNKRFVSKGDTVKMGDIIGLVGSTGLSTGPHLHYEVILNNEPINPLSIYSDTLTSKNCLSYINT